MDEYHLTNMENQFFGGGDNSNNNFDDDFIGGTYYHNEEEKDATLVKLAERDAQFSTSLGKIVRVERVLNGHVNEKVIPDPRYKVKFERHKSLRRNLTPTNSSSNNSSRDDMKLPTSLTSTEKIFKKSQEIIDERMAVSRGSKQSSRSIDGEGSIVLDVDHGLYSPPQLSNNIQSVFIVQSP